jgi:hypothetical protein
MNPKLILSAFLSGVVCALLSSVSSAQSPRFFAEVHVIRSMRQIHSAESTYQATTGSGNFGSLQDLQQAGFIDEALASGAKYGYIYVVSRMPSVPGQSPALFTVSAIPRAYRKSGRRSFYIDTVGEIHGGDKAGSAATSSDPVIDDCTSGSIQDNERCTIADMRALHSAQMNYAATVGNQNFGTFLQLFSAGLISGRLVQGCSRGYCFSYVIIYYVPNAQVASFKIVATPQAYGTTAVRSFFIDQTGVLRGADKNGGPANENDPPINE